MPLKRNLPQAVSQPPEGVALADYHLLEGPQSRTSELITLFQVFRDHLRGLRVLHFVGP